MAIRKKRHTILAFSLGWGWIDIWVTLEVNNDLSKVSTGRVYDKPEEVEMMLLEVRVSLVPG